jgi:RIO kinase 2
MKLDPTLIRYLTNDEHKTLLACEQGSKNHEIVPTQLLTALGAKSKTFRKLVAEKLLAREQSSYDGYRLSWGGYDFLALKTFSKRNTIISVGSQIGVGKESDIYLVQGYSNHENTLKIAETESLIAKYQDAINEENQDFLTNEIDQLMAKLSGLMSLDQDETEPDLRILKLQRLGRISFRNVKQKRDYLKNKKTGSWLYMSRLGAMREYAFMKILYENNFPVPMPIDQNRHCLVMEYIPGKPLCQLYSVPDAESLYAKLMELIVRLACSGLIHGDFNEFNIMIREETYEPVLIDFPQMVSINHFNAQEMFDRDVQCIRDFFQRRFKVTGMYPRFSSIERALNLDEEVYASGYGLDLKETGSSDGTEDEATSNSDKGSLEQEDKEKDEQEYEHEIKQEEEQETELEDEQEEKVQKELEKEQKANTSADNQRALDHEYIKRQVKKQLKERQRFKLKKKRNKAI